MTVAGLLLAAGAGRRLGRPKALVEVGGQTLAVRGARLLADGGCDPVLVVIGAEAERVRAVVLAGTGTGVGAGPAASRSHSRIVVADDWPSGMGASLRAGLAALEADQDVAAVVVALADQPRVGVEAVRRLIAARLPAGAGAAVATYGGQARNPVLLRREVWPEVAEGARGDVGARAWLRAHPDRVVAVACDDTGSPADVDTPADLSALTDS